MTFWLVNFLAIGFLVFLAVVVLRFAIRGAITRAPVLEAVRVSSGLVGLGLVVLSSRGEIGHWGMWLGIGMGIAGLTAFLLFSRT